MKILWIITFMLSSAYATAQEKPVSAQKLYEQGQEAYERGEYQKALSLLNMSLKESPGLMEAYLTRAATREQLKDLAGANTDYGIYLDANPDQPNALYSAAVIQYRIGLYPQSKAYFEKLLTLPPGETTAIYFRLSASGTDTNQVTSSQSSMTSLILNYLGMIETKLKNYKTAIQRLDSAIKLQGKEADYFVNRGIAKQGLQDTTAYSDYKKALQLNPQHAIARHNIANLKRNTGKNDESVDEIEKAIESDSSMLEPYLARAFQRMEGGYYKGALEDYTKALEIDNKNPEIWLNRGIVKERTNDLKGAYADYTQAIELNEKYEKAWLNRANILMKQNKFKEAAEDYTIAILHKEDYAIAFYNRGLARHRLKLITEACEDLNKAESLGQAIPEKVKKEICR